MVWCRASSLRVSTVPTPCCGVSHCTSRCRFTCRLAWLIVLILGPQLACVECRRLLAHALYGTLLVSPAPPLSFSPALLLAFLFLHAPGLGVPRNRIRPEYVNRTLLFGTTCTCHCPLAGRITATCTTSNVVRDLLLNLLGVYTCV